MHRVLSCPHLDAAAQILRYAVAISVKPASSLVLFDIVQTPHSVV
jgi:hypothetical protein